MKGHILQSSIYKFIRTGIIVGVVVLLTWGVTRADTFNFFDSVEKDFSANGVVSEITSTSLSIEKAQGSNDKTQTAYDFDLNFINTVETKNYEPIVIEDIKVGDRVIVKGQEKDGKITIVRIISFDYTSAVKEDMATSTVATTSMESASSTDTSTSTLEIITNTVSNILSNIVNSITDVLNGTSTETTSIESATSTVEGTVDTDKENIEEKTPIENNGGLIDSVKETITNIMDIVTGDQNQEESVSEETSNSSEIETPAESPSEPTADSITETPN